MKLACTGRVKVWLVHREGNDGPYPWKWAGECSCGWRTLSWSWSRRWETEHGLRDPEDSTHGGTLINALEHVGLVTDPGTYWA